MSSNVTIVLAPGTYRLTRSLYFNATLRNIGLRSATGDSDDVQLIGSGMTNADYGPVPYVEYSIFEFTTAARDDYPKAIDVHGGANWRIRHNLFRNLQAPAGQLIGPAVLIWRGSSGTLTEGNTFVNCGRGIIYGGEDAPGSAHRGGIIRNNFFYRSSAQPGDVGIQIADSPDTQVLHNTVILSGTDKAAIEYRYPTNGAVIANYLVDGTIWARDGATATLSANIINAVPSMFVNVATGDLHLRPTAARAIDQGIALPNAATDWDGDRRPNGAGFDAGTDGRVVAAT
jgi:hypothetical protein